MAHNNDTTPAAGRPAGNPTTLRVLRLLFELAQQDVPAHPGTIAAHLGLSTRRVARHLLALDRAGLVTAERSRLTMSGLVLATRLAPVAKAEPATRRPSRVPTPRQGRTRAGVRVKRARVAVRLPEGWARA